MQLSAKLERIGGYAFESCTALRQIELPQGVTELAAGAFKGCTALEYIELPSSMTHVTASLFYECESLKSAVLPDSIESIASEAFSYSGLESISVPASVKTVYQTAFQECFALKKAEIAAEEVGTAAFLDCWALKNVTFGKTVKKLGKNVFGGCTALTDVSFSGTKPELADNSFNEVTATVGYPEEANNADGVIVNVFHRIFCGHIEMIGLHRNETHLDVPVAAELLPANLIARSDNEVRTMRGIDIDPCSLSQCLPAEQCRKTTEHTCL